MTKLITLFAFIIFQFGFSQSNNIESTFFRLIDYGDYANSKILLNQINDEKLLREYKTYLNIFQNGDFSNFDENRLSTSISSEKLKIMRLTNNAIKHYFLNGNELKAYNLLKTSLDIAKKHNLKTFICLNSKLILEIYSRSIIRTNDISYKYILNNFQNNATSIWETNLVQYYDYKITMRYFYIDSTEAIKRKYLKVNRLFQEDTLTFIKAQLYITNSSYQNRITKNLDSSYYYLNLANIYFKKDLGYYKNEKNISMLVNRASLYFQNKNYKTSLNILNNIELNNDGYLFDILKLYINFYKYQNYLQLKDNINALKYQNLYLTQQLIQNQSNNIQLISEYETKYETEKKEKENLLLKTDVEKKQRQNRNLWIGSILFLVFGGTTAFLIQKNTKRKQLLAEQEKALETQKLTTVLKEQELTSIDAMIEGQEKERQRIANDLHDDLGGLMATVKLHFNALKDKNSPELFDKTNQLIDEAYNKVRTVAHAKNSGVIAKQGLLKAVHNIAEKISASNKIEIDVIDYGLENRLENSLELTIFRIIQELVTNVIKHAEATEATIHITNHDVSLNIMIEDNGKGFNPSQITKTNKGMGISSIDKRVEHLNGNMTIESEHNKGTTIIIDIPL